MPRRASSWPRGERIAYFSAEFGLTEVLPDLRRRPRRPGRRPPEVRERSRRPDDGSGPVLPRGLLPPGPRRARAARPRPTRCSSPTSCRSRSPSRPTAAPPIVSVKLAGRNVNLLIRLARVGRVPRPAARLEPAGERAARPRGHGRGSTAAATRCGSSRRSCSASAARARSRRSSCGRRSATSTRATRPSCRSRRSAASCRRST